MRVRISRRAAVMVMGGGMICLWETVRAGGDAEMLWATARIAAVIIAAAVLHELGHAAAAWGWGVPIKTLRLDLFGARMELGGMLSYGDELAVAAGGPLVNLLSAALVLPLCTGGDFGGGVGLFCAASLCLGVLNLMPVQSLDGGRMLNALLSLWLGAEVGEGVVKLTTGLFLGGLWLLSVYALLRAGHMLTLFVFTLCLLFRLLAWETGQNG